eukprot:TRINITY_DN73064_c0_g1_i1.p1 TRINITY_DN73064_c0_g1~~TRINITY_DN73064_c0_g1_i1.p1  ORF type:complete len:302 (+),score=56.70 TRINITY_DN73064_c0_g1_i1:85-990(+)
MPEAAGDGNSASTLDARRQTQLNNGMKKAENWRSVPVAEVMQAMDVDRKLKDETGRQPRAPSPEESAARKAAMKCGSVDKYALIYASEDLRNDKEILMNAAKHDGHVIMYTSDETRKDKELVLQAVRTNGQVLRYSDLKLRKDKEVALAAVSHTGRALRWVDEKLQADKEVVIAAVREDGRALKYASDDLKADKQCVMMAIRNTPMAYSYIPDDTELKANIGDWLEASWGLPIFREGSFQGQSLYYRDCRGIDKKPEDHPELLEKIYNPPNRKATHIVEPWELEGLGLEPSEPAATEADAT